MATGLVASQALAATETAHTDVFSLILLELVGVIAIAGLGRYLTGLVGQPAVLGELLVGIGAGNLGVWLGIPLAVIVMHLSDVGPVWQQVWQNDLGVHEAARRVLEAGGIATSRGGAELVRELTGDGAAARMMMIAALWIFSNLGVILLLFLVGLESSVAEMLEVGASATLVACVGVILPLVLGYGASALLQPEARDVEHLFVGAALTATSVGITAAVLREIGVMQTRSARVILGAAVIDDVLGLLILAVSVGIAANGEVRLGDIARIGVLAAVFLGAVMWIGERTVGVGARLLALLGRQHLKLLFPIGLAFFMAWVASQLGLATIVGAFAAGLILSEEHFGDVDEPAVEVLVGPIERLFAPIFFVLMGMQVDLRAFADPGILRLAGVLIVIALATKALAGFAAGRGTDKILVGIGMIPRGEVGLIFASIGKTMGVLSSSVFSAIVVVVITSTLVTPPMLKWSAGRAGAPAER
jgi:Kef-type K+ transport system membrane component KefB